MPDDAETIEGLLMLASAARNDPNYIKFMALYQVSKEIEKALKYFTKCLFYYLFFKIIYILIHYRSN